MLPSLFARQYCSPPPIQAMSQLRTVMRLAPPPENAKPPLCRIVNVSADEGARIDREPMKCDRHQVEMPASPSAARRERRLRPAGPSRSSWPRARASARPSPTRGCARLTRGARAPRTPTVSEIRFAHFHSLSLISRGARVTSRVEPSGKTSEPRRSSSVALTSETAHVPSAAS